jgi:hypothetical protein
MIAGNDSDYLGAMAAARPIFKLGLQICGSVLIAALLLGAGAWAFLDTASKVVFIIAAVLAIIGLCGIALLLIDFVKSGDAGK